ncbi:ribosome biogenesis factor YjgA [Aliidiomarina sp. Khilg15.8]
MRKTDTLKPDSELAERPNKTQIKRQMDALHKVAQRLVDLSDGSTKKMPIDDELQSAIQLARRIRNTREGFRRQLQLITKLLREANHEEIEASLNNLQRSGDQENALFHELERWRERIINDGDSAIQEFIVTHPNAERQKLRQLVRQIEKEKTQEKPPAAYRELFKYLRSCV